MILKKTLAKTGASINDTNNLDEMIAAQFTNQKKERQVPLIPLSPPSGANDDSTSNSNDKITPGEFGPGPSARVPPQGPTGTRT